MRTLVFLAVLALAAPALAFDHAQWDALLKKHVVLIDGGKASQLDYAGVAQERAALRGYLEALSRVSEAEFNAWSKPEQIAFLVNAYNAAMVDKVLARYPNLKSVWDFGRFFGNPFKDEFLSLFGRRMSLDGIEHGMLRKRYAEPRIHFAVNCASVGCPMLREEAYVGARLEEQLAQQAQRFLSDRTRNRVRGGRLEVSKIFEWYGEDFQPLERYLARHAALLADGAADREKVAAAALAIGFLDYDWSLNAFRSSSPR